MADYVLLYHGGSMPETEAEQAAVMDAWGAWYGGLGEAVKDGGNPFTPAAKASAPTARSATARPARWRAATRS